MTKETAASDSGQSLICSEDRGAEYLCNRFGLSFATAQGIVDGNWGDRGRMEQEAERLAKYEKLYSRVDRRERGVGT